MKDIRKTIEYKGNEYLIVFNFNVMQEIQEEYETIEKWGNLVEPEEGEPNAKAVIYGVRVMLNEGIDITNEENGTDIKPLTHKQVGRMITEIGMQKATAIATQTVVDSTQSAEKNE